MRILGTGIQLLAMLAFVAASSVGIWALAIFGFQINGWLQHGIWQSVPAAALFLSPQAQMFHLQAFVGTDNPLRLVPSLAGMESPDQVAHSMAAGMVGVERIIAWLLDLGLVAWMFVAFSLLALTYAMLLGEAFLLREAPQHRDSAVPNRGGTSTSIDRNS